METFNIRRVCNTERDINLAAPLFDLYRQFYEQPADLPGGQAFTRDRLSRAESVIYAAEATGIGAPGGGPLWGFVQLDPSFSSVAAAPIWILNDLFVLERVRHLGIGRALLERARAHAITTGARRLILETLAMNLTAQRLYESVGYCCDNSRVRFYTASLPHRPHGNRDLAVPETHPCFDR